MKAKFSRLSSAVLGKRKTAIQQCRIAWAHCKVLFKYVLIVLRHNKAAFAIAFIDAYSAMKSQQMRAPQRMAA